MSQQVDVIPIDHLQPNPLQPRGSISQDSLVDLVDSIKKHGVLEPLVVAQTPAGLQIVAGERRWRASKLAGLTEVPAIIKQTTPQGMLEMAIIENVQRTDLNPIERAKAFERLQVEFGLTTTEISERVSKSPSYVSNSLRLLKLPDALKDGLLTGVITEGHARALAAIEDQRAMIEAYKIVLREGASVRRAEELARRYKHVTGTGHPKKTDPEKTLILSDELDRMQDAMQDALGKASKVSLKQSIRQTKILITIKGSPDDTKDKLEKVYKAVTG
jgi:ParB family transcriptional regulator, chromosome partitioning protein